MRRVGPRAGWAGGVLSWLSLALLVLWGTGVLMYLLPASELMDMSESQAALRRTSGIVHGVTTWLVCGLCGRGVWPHVQLMWSHRVDRRQWSWGVVNLTVLLVLLASGLVLLYGHADVHELTSTSHVWVGLLAPLPYVVHGWRVWRKSAWRA
jgi:hypothetical protein